MNLIGRTDGRTDETDAQTDETDAQTDETDAQTTLGVKRVTAAILPLLRPSPVGARIINVSSGLGGLRRLSNKYREEFNRAVSGGSEEWDMGVWRMARRVRDVLQHEGGSQRIHECAGPGGGAPF
jgi:hypothetical protein